jgi:hypothetical protein
VSRAEEKARDSGKKKFNISEKKAVPWRWRIVEFGFAL